MPVQNKRSLEPGDSREQLVARREFLAAGYFLGLANKLTEFVPAAAQSLLDIGCGEGTFTLAMAEAYPSLNVIGLDIAKAGVRMAARSAQIRRVPITYCVASSYGLPILDNSIDVITRIYAPSKDEELRRVLKPKGRLIVVSPGPQHLLGLRQCLYQTVRPHLPPATPKGFRLDDLQEIESSVVIKAGAHALSLLEMTPFAWKMPAEKKQELAAADLVDQLNFQFSCYSPE